MSNPTLVYVLCENKDGLSHDQARPTGEAVPDQHVAEAWASLERPGFRRAYYAVTIVERPNDWPAVQRYLDSLPTGRG